MKITKLILVFCLFCQFGFGQTLTRKSLHGMVINDSIKIQSGYVLNVSSHSRSAINNEGYFDLSAKTNDTLFISSFGFQSKKIVLTSSNFKSSVFIVSLDVLVNQLEVVVVGKKKIVKPNLGSIQKIVDTQYIDDAQSSLDNPLMPVDMKYAMDLGRVGKMVWGVFVKTPDNSKIVEYGNFSQMVQQRIKPSFFTKTLNLKEEEVGLFLGYCEDDPASKALLKPEVEFELIEFLIDKNEDFKKMNDSNK